MKTETFEEFYNAMDTVKKDSFDFLDGVSDKQKLVQTINQSLIEKNCDSRNAFSDLLSCFRKLSYVSKNVSLFI